MSRALSQTLVDASVTSRWDPVMLPSRPMSPGAAAYQLWSIECLDVGAGHGHDDSTHGTARKCGLVCAFGECCAALAVHRLEGREPMRSLSAKVLTVWSPAREQVYAALLAAGLQRCWTVRKMAEAMPDDISAGTVRTVLYLLLGDAVLELVPRQPTLTLRLCGDGAAVLAEILAQWRGGDLVSRPRRRWSGSMTPPRVRAVAPVPVLPRPDEAQILLEAHLCSDLGGRCVTCGQFAPCHLRGLAHAAFKQAGRLPQRRRGLGLIPRSKRFRAFGTAV